MRREDQATISRIRNIVFRIFWPSRRGVASQKRTFNSIYIHLEQWVSVIKGTSCNFGSIIALGWTNYKSISWQGLYGNKSGRALEANFFLDISLELLNRVAIISVMSNMITIPAQESRNG